VPAGSVAARAASWGLRSRNLPGPQYGASLGGMPFMTGIFGPTARIWVEFAFGADPNGLPDFWSWTDVTADVMYATRVAISLGRGDETSKAAAAGLGFTLLNSHAAYSAYNPASMYYPNVRRNTPVRVRVDLGSGPTVLYVGNTVGFTPGWDTSAKLAIVSVTAGGTLRRLGQGKTPLRSASYRAITTTAIAPYAYWTMEDGSTAVNFASTIAGVAALAITGTVGIGAAAGPGTAASADFSGGGSVAAALPVPAGTASAWRVALSFSSSVASGDFVPLHIETATGTVWEVEIDTTSSNGPTIHVGTEAPGLVSNSVSYTHSGGAWAAGTWHSIILDGVQTGADMGFTMTVDGSPFVDPSAFTAQQLGAITSIVVNPATPAFLTKTSSAFLAAHLAVWASNPSDNLWSPAAGWAGETADERLIRLCAEESIPFTITGTSTMAMGAQPVAAILDVLRECETADGGVLYDGFTAGLAYTCRTARYNLTAALTVDVALGQLSTPFAPVDDDQRNRNDVTVSRTGGATARYIATTGPLGTDTIGTYDTSVQVNTSDDTPLLNIAGWNAHLGTVQGLRYPTLPLDFTATPTLAQKWLDAPNISYRADVVNIDQKATQHPPDDVALIVEGYTMTLDTNRWTATAACSQYAPWQVGALDDPVLGHLDTAGCVIAAGGWDGTSATFAVTTTTGPLWTTSGADYPFDLNVGGQRVTVSGCTGASNPQTFTVSVASVNGVAKFHSPGDALSLWSPLILAL